MSRNGDYLSTTAIGKGYAGFESRRIGGALALYYPDYPASPAVRAQAEIAPAAQGEETGATIAAAAQAGSGVVAEIVEVVPTQDAVLPEPGEESGAEA
jgi:hypothetical protein